MCVCVCVCVCVYVCVFFVSREMRAAECNATPPINNTKHSMPQDGYYMYAKIAGVMSPATPYEVTLQDKYRTEQNQTLVLVNRRVQPLKELFW